ncbi:MAG: TetR family transcriptional regulator C-terminal domain-containing protein [Burkholderiales bacterium]|nr:TetR family transcriptional regulator C-terminal domain-containing protein [Burkholderiales bacterium]
MSPPPKRPQAASPPGGRRQRTGRAGSAASTGGAAAVGGAALDGVAATVVDAGAKGLIRQANEAVILGAGERVFARAGFNGATMGQIADEAGLPKANLHYYFGSKRELYQAVLARTLHDWLVPMDGLVAEADPRTALEQYIRAKMQMSRERPDASRVFANELLHGAEVLGELMRTELRTMVRRKAAVIEGWVAAGRMAPVDATHLFFTIWAATQTYADFDVQVRAVLGRNELTARDHQRAADHVAGLILRGCGL